MRIKIRCKLKVIFGFFWACTFPWAYMVTFKILLYMWLLLSVLVLKCLASKKGKKERRRRKKRFSSNPLKSLQVRVLQQLSVGLETAALASVSAPL